MTEYLFTHAIFIWNLAVVAGLIVWWVACSFLREPVQRRAFVLLSVLLVLIRAGYVALFALVAPDRIDFSDGARYLYEIQQISLSPGAWNPVTGTGPYYQATPKMGMSYLYGLIMHVHNVHSLGAVLVLNIFFSLMTSLVVFALTTRLTESVTPPFYAAFLTAIYPETLFWTARVLRENMTILLVPLIVYWSIRFFESFRVRYLAGAFFSTLVIMLVRAQLSLIIVLVTGYLGAATLRAASRGGRGLAAGAILVGITGLTLPLLLAQVRHAAGSAIAVFGSASFWTTQTQVLADNLGDVLTPVAREGNGAAGLLIAPFSLSVAGFFALAVVGRRRIFAGHERAAGLLIFLTFAVIMALALAGAINIRFRSNVAPLVIPLVSVAAYDYLRRMGWPLLRLDGPRLTAQAPTAAPVAGAAPSK